MAGPSLDSGDAVGIDSSYKWVMLGGVWFLYVCFGLINQSLAPLVSTIVDDLGISFSEMGRVLGAWQFVYLFSAIPLGIAVDKFGLKISLTVAAAIIAASAFARGFATDSVTLWLAVSVFGFGGPLISVGAPKVISQWFGSRDRGTAMGIYMTGPALGGIAALSLSNSVLMPLVDNEWRHVFFILGAVVLMSGFTWIIVNVPAVSRLGEQSAAATSKTGRFKVFGELLRVPLVIAVLVMSVGIFTFNHGLNNWLPSILRAGGMSDVTAGYWAAIPTLVGVAGSLLIPRFATKEHRFKILTGLFVAALLATILLRIGEGPVLATGLIAQGIARSSLMTLSILVLMEAPQVGSKNMGVAGGLFFTAAELGGVLGPVSIGAIADKFGGFDAALWMLTVICVVMIGISFVVRQLDAAARR